MRLQDEFAEADTAYNLANVAQQQENAAELAKAKEAERVALMEHRAELEVQRQEDLEAIMDQGNEKWNEKEETARDIQNMRESLNYLTDENERNALLESMATGYFHIEALEADLKALETQHEALVEQHNRERAEEKAYDKSEAEKEAKEAEFNARAAEVISTFTDL